MIILRVTIFAILVATSYGFLKKDPEVLEELAHAKIEKIKDKIDLIGNAKKETLDHIGHLKTEKLEHLGNIKHKKLEFISQVKDEKLALFDHLKQEKVALLQAKKEKAWSWLPSWPWTSEEPEISHDQTNIARYPVWKIHKYNGVEIRPVKVITHSNVAPTYVRAVPTPSTYYKHEFVAPAAIYGPPEIPQPLPPPTKPVEIYGPPEVSYPVPPPATTPAETYGPPDVSLPLHPPAQTYWPPQQSNFPSSALYHNEQLPLPSFNYKQDFSTAFSTSKKFTDHLTELLPSVDYSAHNQFRTYSQPQPIPEVQEPHVPGLQGFQLPQAPELPSIGHNFHFIPVNTAEQSYTSQPEQYEQYPPYPPQERKQLTSSYGVPLPPDAYDAPSESVEVTAEAPSNFRSSEDIKEAVQSDNQESLENTNQETVSDISKDAETTKSDGSQTTAQISS